MSRSNAPGGRSQVAGTGGQLRTIRAGEIGEYGYCSRAWWYKHVARLPAQGSSGRLRKGRQAHARHGRVVAVSIRLRAAGLLLMLLGLLMLLALGVVLLLNAR